MDYATAREIIKDGDIIFIKRRKDSINPFSWLTTKLLHTRFYHVAVAVWMESDYGNRRLMVVEAHAGARRMVPMSLYSNHSMEVLRLKNLDFSKVADNLIENVGVINYGYLDFVMIGIKEIFGLPSRDNNGEVCSEMAAKMLIQGGYKKLSDSLVSPKKLYEEMIDDPEGCQYVILVNDLL